jgi:hypothetical protein
MPGVMNSYFQQPTGDKAADETTQEKNTNFTPYQQPEQQKG